MTNKIDKEIGKQKFKAKRQYIVEVEYEGEAYTKDQFEELIPTELSVEYSEYGNQGNDIELTYNKWFPQSTEKDFSGRIIQLDITEKLGEYIAETDIDYDGNSKLDNTNGTWTNDEFEYLKNEDGTDIKGND
jgi:hypothetical protein|tara:strand:- start:400 stop:795 length:396 start_codon:yes stop_codon:yes gene_type:complete